jgi:hypothetical protein
MMISSAALKIRKSEGIAPSLLPGEHDAASSSMAIADIAKRSGVAQARAAHCWALAGPVSASAGALCRFSSPKARRVGFRRLTGGAVDLGNQLRVGLTAPASPMNPTITEKKQ